MGEQLEKTEKSITIEAEKVEDIADNTVQFEDVVAE